MPEIGVLGLVPDHWSAQWQLRHYVLSRLARYFEVVWMNSPHQRHQVFQKIKDYTKNTTENELALGLTVYTPEPWLPLIFRPEKLGVLTFRCRLRKARDILARKGCRKTILYLWRPEYYSALFLSAHDASFYHIDDEYSFSSVELPVDPSEYQLITQVDHVFVTSLALLEKKGGTNVSASFVPNGVDYELYSRNHPEPSDLASISHPRIGYAGWLKRQLDWTLLLRLAKKYTTWSFVFVGGRKAHFDIEQALSEISSLRNVYLLGSKTTEELAAYPQHFDVCIMPYTLDAYTTYIYPLKLHEYLASGKPTIGTKIRSLMEFGDVVRLCSNFDEWCSTLIEALSPASNTADQCSARQKVAQSHDWHCLAALIAKTMVSKLGPEYGQRFDNLAGDELPLEVK
jgi:glycosyltransferase involved in cell wall biosynthesis